ETILLETREETAIVWLNRPPTNPISPQMIRDVTAVWDEIESRDAVRAVVFASSNFAVFCAGADIKEFTKMTDPAAGKDLLDSGHGLLRRMEQSAKVTIAAVNSLALGGGCEVSMGCDFRIAAESASFGQPEINLGIIPGFGGTPRLARLVALTGAGVSVPSGIPDFRTPGKGLWAKVDPMAVATIDAFHGDTKRFWDFFRPRFHDLADKEPNPAHTVLAELERRGRLGAVITQNIDRLHRRAGSEDVIEVHGSIATASCTSCAASYPL